MARTLLLGSAGQLGTELAKLLAPDTELLALSRHDVNLSDKDALRIAIRQARPQVIVNAAAYTAVDRAESEPDLAHAVNAVAPGILAEEALRLDAWLIHFSTDYVFDGSGREPWKEIDSPHPLNVYGQTKLEGERSIAATDCRHLIFRTSWVYAAHGSNFLRTMLRLGRERPRLTIVDDQFGSPTSAGELARAVSTVLTRLANFNSAPVEPGIFHMTCGGVTNWFGFAKAIFSGAAGLEQTPELVPIPSEQYPTPAVRPRNSALNCGKLEKTFGVRLAPWEDALAQVLVELEKSGQ